jgi:hypothetical protein
LSRFTKSASATACYFSIKFVEAGQLDEVVTQGADVDPAAGATDREAGAHCSLRA